MDRRGTIEIRQTNGYKVISSGPLITEWTVEVGWGPEQGRVAGTAGIFVGGHYDGQRDL